MKKIFLLSAFIIAVAPVNAQVTSLNENFDAACQGSTGPTYPSGWNEYNVIPSISNLWWNCTPNGENNTPGMQCYGNYNGNNYLDTAWLFTPELELNSYTGNVYFQFDAKYDYVAHTAGRLAILTSNSIDPDSNATITDLTDSVHPQSFINPVDSSTWVTYQINLTYYKSTPLYMAFRYTSNLDSAGIWTLDNIKGISKNSLFLLRELYA